MSKFAKIFEAAGQQILVRKDCDEKGTATVIVEVQPHSNQIVIGKLVFKTVEDRNNFFNDIGAQRATEIASVALLRHLSEELREPDPVH